MMEILLFHAKLDTGGLAVKLLPTHKVSNTTKKERIKTKSNIQASLKSFSNLRGARKTFMQNIECFRSI